MDRTEELEEQVSRLSRMVEDLKDRLARVEGGRSRKGTGERASNRREFLRLGGAAAIGAVGAAALNAMLASAANGGTFTLGQANLAESPTTIQGDSVTPPVQVLGVEAAATTWNPLTTGTFAGPLQGLGTIGAVEGVDGWASGATGYGVYGLTDAGTGVTGESSTGIGLYARSSGRLRQDGPFAGQPTHTPNLFEQVRDSSGVLWIHNAAVPVAWRRVNTARADAADGLGGAFKPLRIVDTRKSSGPAGATGGSASSGSTRTYQVAGDVGSSSASQIPADAIAVFGNLTAIGGARGGFMAIHPAGVAYDPANDPATFNFSAGGVTSNGFFCGLGTGGSLGKIAVYIGIYGSSRANFIIDITGYVQ